MDQDCLRYLVECIDNKSKKYAKTRNRHGCRALCVARTAEGDFRLKGYLPVYYTNKETLTTLEFFEVYI